METILKLFCDENEKAPIASLGRPTIVVCIESQGLDTLSDSPNTMFSEKVVIWFRVRDTSS